MPSKTPVEKLGFSCTDYETDSHDNGTKIWCKICREFYSDQDASSQKKGVAKKCANLFVNGATTTSLNAPLPVCFLKHPCKQFNSL